MEKIKHHIKLLSYIGIGIIGMLIINSILYTHSQTLADGSVIVHAHPYNKTSNPPSNHKHKADELLILNSIVLLFFIVTLSFNFQKQLINFEKTYFPQVRYINILSFRKLGRAPPIQ